MSDMKAWLQCSVAHSCSSVSYFVLVSAYQTYRLCRMHRCVDANTLLRYSKAESELPLRRGITWDHGMIMLSYLMLCYVMAKHRESRTDKSGMLYCSSDMGEWNWKWRCLFAIVQCSRTYVTVGVRGHGFWKLGRYVGRYLRNNKIKF